MVSISDPIQIKQMETKVQNLWEDFLDAVSVLEVMKKEDLSDDISHEDMKKKLGF